MEFSLVNQEHAREDQAAHADHVVPEESTAKPRLSFAYDERALKDLYSPSRLRLRRSASVSSNPTYTNEAIDGDRRGHSSPVRRREVHNSGAESAPHVSRNSSSVVSAAGWTAAVASEEIRKLQELIRSLTSDLRARENELMMAHEANRSLQRRLDEASLALQSKVPDPSSFAAAAPQQRQQPEPEPTAPSSMNQSSCTDDQSCNLDVQTSFAGAAISTGLQDRESDTLNMCMSMDEFLSDIACYSKPKESRLPEVLSVEQLRDRLHAECSQCDRKRKQCQNLQNCNKQLQQKLDECEAAVLKLAREFPNFPQAPDLEQTPDLTFADAFQIAFRDVVVGCVNTAPEGATRARPNPIKDILRVLGIDNEGAQVEHIRWDVHHASASLHLSSGERHARFIRGREQKPRGLAVTDRPLQRRPAAHADDAGLTQTAAGSDKEIQEKVSFEVRVDSIHVKQADGLVIGFISAPPRKLPPNTVGQLGEEWLAGPRWKMYLSSEPGRLFDCAWRLFDLECGDCVRVTMVSGEFVVFVNGEEVCRAIVDLPIGGDLYGIVDLTGSVDRLAIVE